jgi:hypothetical protein
MFVYNASIEKVQEEKRKSDIPFLYWYHFSGSDRINEGKYFTLQARNGGIVMVNFYSGFIQCNESKNATVDDVIGEYLENCRTVVNVSVQESIFRFPSTLICLI